MTGKELSALCREQAGQGYVWGGLGYTLTDSRLSQLKTLYPTHYTADYIAKCKKLMGKKVYDCAGLIKHFLWGNTGNGTLMYYGSNGIPDTTANGLIDLCKRNGAMTTLPETPGLILWKDGHVGIYLGSGKAVEARGIDYGVVITEISSRGWAKWGELPGVVYDTAPVPVPVPAKDTRDNIPASWAKTAVEKAIANNIIVGDATGDLMLNSLVTRQELCVILDRCGIMGK